jgi:hypothetical protein
MDGWQERMRWSNHTFTTVVWPEARRVFPPGDLVSVQADGTRSQAAHKLDLAGVDFLVVDGRCITATIASRVQRLDPPPSTVTLGVPELWARTEAIFRNGLVPDFTVQAYVNVAERCTQAIVVPTRDLVSTARSSELNWKVNLTTGARFAVISVGQMRSNGATVTVVEPGSGGAIIESTTASSGTVAFWVDGGSGNRTTIA